MTGRERLLPSGWARDYDIFTFPSLVCGDRSLQKEHVVVRWLVLASCCACVWSANGGRYVLAADERLSTLLETFVNELVEITPGEGRFPPTFLMGSEEAEEEQPVHEVTLRHPFAMSRYEVPQNLYQAVMGANPSRWKGPRNSAERMSHGEALEFCEKLTGLLRDRKLIAADEEIRLPTEAEWEYCCRAGTRTAYSFGEEPRRPEDDGLKASILNEYAWHAGNAAGNDPPVGALKPNPWGLYDMHGYLWELTLDDWSPSHEGASPDGSARRGKTDEVVIRGGSWKSGYRNLRCASRRGFAKTDADDAVGFRCVRAKITARSP